MLSDYAACKLLRYAERLNNMLDASPAACRAQNFPEATSFKTSFSSVKSETAHRKAETKELASKAAEDWYLTLQGKMRAGVLESGPTFKKAAEQFFKAYGVITEGERSDKWTESHNIRLRVHLVPFFGDLPLNKVTSGKVQEYRVHRMTSYAEPNPNSKSKYKPKAKPPAANTALVAARGAKHRARGFLVSGHIYGVTDTQAFLAMSPNGTVPVLRDGEGKPLQKTRSGIHQRLNLTKNNDPIMIQPDLAEDAQVAGFKSEHRAASGRNRWLASSESAHCAPGGFDVC